MCEEIGKLNFNAGEHVFLENIEIQVNKNMAAVPRNRILGPKFKQKTKKL